MRLSMETILPAAATVLCPPKETTEDETVGWHHRLNGLEFEQSSGDRERQGNLVHCSPWGRKEFNTT